MIHSLVAHVHSFVNLTQRVKFVNEFVFTKALHLLQLFDFTNAQWAKINKCVGFFLWRGSILKINRQTLTLPCHAGGLNLWDLRLKGKALRIRRTLQIISEYDHTVSSALFTTIFHHMTLDTPLDINLWKHICPYLQEVFVEIAYSLLQRLPIDTWTSKQIYESLFQRDKMLPANVQLKEPTKQWSLIWQNLAFLRFDSTLFSLWYSILHGNYPTNAKLHAYGIVKQPTCSSCLQLDSMTHKVTECGYRRPIWQTFLSIYSRISGTHGASVTFSDIVLYPQYRHFPPARKKFLLWLVAVTLQICLVESDINTPTLYKATLLLRYFNILAHVRRRDYASYYTAIY
jgi:hypothetical protein